MRTSGVGVGEGVKVGEDVMEGVTPGGGVGLGVPVGMSGAGLRVHAARSNVRNTANNRLITMPIFIIEKRMGVNACQSG